MKEWQKYVLYSVVAGVLLEMILDYLRPRKVWPGGAKPGMRPLDIDPTA